MVEPIIIRGLPENAPELDLWRRLAEYGELRSKRIAKLPAHRAALAKLAFVGLQQRLLSSICVKPDRLLDGDSQTSALDRTDQKSRRIPRLQRGGFGG
jgi:hypothetical protein